MRRSRALPVALVLVVVTLLAACAGRAPRAAHAAPDAAVPASTDTPAAAVRAWWEAYTVADTARLRARSAPTLRVTLSSGATLDLAAALAQAATHVQGASMRLAWEGETAWMPAPGVAVIASEMTETLAGTSQSYRYLTTLERRDGTWRVLAAQSTRLATLTRRVGADVAGPLADYAGDYATPRGLVLRVVARDSALVLVEPSGAELRMEPVGPGLFEFTRLSPANGIVRFAFTRDASGRVVAFSRLITGQVTTFPRKVP